jgi:predicted branched-subunit amino acid permease
MMMMMMVVVIVVVVVTAQWSNWKRQPLVQPGGVLLVAIVVAQLPVALLCVAVCEIFAESIDRPWSNHKKKKKSEQ